MNHGCQQRPSQSEELRAQLHGMWSGRGAGGWAEHAAFVDARGAALTERLLELAQRPSPASGCSSWRAGAGGAGLAAAPRWRPSGEVVLSDVAPEMTAIAAARAEALGLRNVTHAGARSRAASTSRTLLRRRALPRGADARPRPGARRHARSGASCARRPGRADRLGAAGPEPLARHRLRRGQRPARHAAAPARHPRPLLARGSPTGSPVCSSTAGLADVEVGELPTPYRAGSVDEWWTRTAALAGPLAQRLAALPRAGRAGAARPRRRRDQHVPDARRARASPASPGRLGAARVRKGADVRSAAVVLGARNLGGAISATCLPGYARGDGRAHPGRPGRCSP